MSEKPIAVILAGIGAVSLCVICVLGPAVLGSATGWMLGWFGGLSPMATTGLAIFTALVVYALFRRWGAKGPHEHYAPVAFSDSTERKV